MITGQENFDNFIKKFPKSREILKKFGITPAFIKKNKCKNIAEAALKRQIPIAHLLKEISEITGEPIKKPKIKGLPKIPVKPTGTPRGIKKVLAFHSGKGGVGKTFISVNVALALAQKGYKTGLLDADIDCPNVTNMLKIKGKFRANKEKKIIPLEKKGVKIVSIGPMLKNEEESLLWRGPIIARAVEQLIYDVDWGDLDFLIVDLPPGTSDVPISIMQLLNNQEVIIITTPQELALLDAKKSASMAKKLKIPIKGIIENMSGSIFGQGGGKALAKKLGVVFLGSIPLKKEFNDFSNTNENFKKIVSGILKN